VNITVHGNHNTINNNNNNNNTINNHNNTINNNIVIKQDFSDWLSTPFLHECTTKEKKQILEVLEILCDKGYKTAQDVQEFIMKEYRTIQHLEQKIQKYDLEALKDFVGNSRPKWKGNAKDKAKQANDKEYMDSHINNCIVAFFNMLISKDEVAITPEVLASNPLYKGNGGSLKAWSIGDVKPCDGNRKLFGVPSSTKGITMRQWTPMQDEATWINLVKVISLRFIEALNNDRLNSDWSSPDYEKLAKYWEQKLEDGERPAVIDELCIDLATTCRQDHTKGWYNLTNMLAKKQKYLDTPVSSSDPSFIEEG